MNTPLDPPPVAALVGPTGAGKTEVAVALAQRFDAEIVNADSRQVYRRLDIGSAKPTPAQRAAVRHHLIDVVEPDEAFDCARYRELACAAIADIRARDKRVLVVGGTGLYVRVLARGVFAGPGRDPELRERLRNEERAAPGFLHRRLAAVDAPAAARLHPNDLTRLIRALEVYERSGRPISAWQREHGFRDRAFDIRLFVLSRPREELYARIEARCAAMLRDGLVDEVRSLLAAGFSPDLPALQSPGYREIAQHLRGECDLQTAVERMARATRRLAKRQLTWFRGEPRAEWCGPMPSELVPRLAALWE